MTKKMTYTKVADILLDCLDMVGEFLPGAKVELDDEVGLQVETRLGVFGVSPDMPRDMVLDYVRVSLEEAYADDAEDGAQGAVDR